MLSTGLPQSGLLTTTQHPYPPRTFRDIEEIRSNLFVQGARVGVPGLTFLKRQQSVSKIQEN